MTDWREELIEKMARYIACASSSEDDPTTEWCDENWPAHENQARAALAAAEPVIREQADDALREENARLREEIERLKGERATDKTSNGCRVCGLQFTDSLGRLTAMGYSCRRDDCPSRVSC